MDEKELREQIVETGKKLLETGLVARTWGNISGRLNENTMLITPSGLDYLHTEPEDIVLYHLQDDSREGRRKPSSESGIHAAAYRQFPEVNFVIHTHQSYATALGLSGWDRMKLTRQEEEALGGIGKADYGLPGQKQLWQNVENVLKQGKHIVLMAHHGALICGLDRDDTMKRAVLLEEICMRHVKCPVEEAENVTAPDQNTITPDRDAAQIRNQILQAQPGARLFQTPAILTRANSRKPIRAQLDDMAQMIGFQIPLAEKKPTDILRKLQKYGAVLVPGVGAFTLGKDDDDTEALGILTDKAAVSSIHTEQCGELAELPFYDVILMRLFYELKYSRKKGEKVHG